MSINDPDTQELILVHANDPDAVGKILISDYKSLKLLILLALNIFFILTEHKPLIR